MKKRIKHNCNLCNITVWSNNDKAIWGYCTCGKQVSVDKDVVEDIIDRAVEQYKSELRTFIGV